MAERHILKYKTANEMVLLRNFGRPQGRRNAEGLVIQSSQQDRAG